MHAALPGYLFRPLLLRSPLFHSPLSRPLCFTSLCFALLCFTPLCLAPLCLAPLLLHSPLFRSPLSQIKELGADPRHKKVNGATAVFMAAQNGHDECIRFLVNECGVDVDSPKNDGATTMFIAAQNGNASTCTVLAELGGKVDECFSGTTPVHIAATHQHLSTIKALYLAGSRADPDEWLPDLGDLDKPELYFAFLRWVQGVAQEPWEHLSPYVGPKHHHHPANLAPHQPHHPCDAPLPPPHRANPPLDTSYPTNPTNHHHPQVQEEGVRRLRLADLGAGMQPVQDDLVLL